MIKLLACSSNNLLFFKIWGKIFVIFIFWIIVFLPVYPELWHSWLNNSDNSHGILVPFISAFLCWRQKDRLSKVPISNSKWGGMILIISLAIYLIALAGHVAFIQRIMIVLSLVGLILFNFGKAFLKILFFPVLFLIFMIPIPVTIYGIVSFPLQLIATNISCAIIQFFNIPVFQEGNLLFFTNTQLEVVEACSGLRSMIAFLMLAALFAYLLRNVWWRGCLLIFSAVPLAIVANILRVVSTGIFAHLYGDKMARGFLHNFSGITVFAFGFIFLFFEYNCFSKFKKIKINAH
jgi:exosortase